MKLLKLPPEILYEIVDSVDHNVDLANLRLGCKALSNIATPTLFSSVHIYPQTLSSEDPDSETEDWHSIAQDDLLRFHVRHVVIQCASYQHEVSELLDYLRFRFPAGSTLRGHFPNIRSLNLRLPKHIRAGFGHTREFFTALARVCACSLHSLTISHVDILRSRPNTRPLVQLADFWSDPDTPNLTTRRLHLSLKGSPTDLLYSRSDPGVWPHVCENWAVIPRHLKSHWLKPNAAILTHLSLYCNNYWGAFPPINFKSVSFPQLKTLALGNYCFAYPEQLDSLLAIQSIESLLLDDCPILFLTMLYNWSLDNPKFIIDPSHWEQLESKNQGMYSIFRTKTSWKEYFARIAEGLPRLRRFGFRPGDWSYTPGGPLAMEQHDEWSVNWHPQSRYAAFCAGTCSWLEVLSKPPDREDKFFRVDLDKELNWQLRQHFTQFVGARVPQVEPERIDGDVAALEKLLAVVDARARGHEEALRRTPRLSFHL